MNPALNSRFLILDSRHAGQATLSLVFLIGGIIILVGVSLSFLVISFISSGYGYQASNRALGAATGGVEDALLRLVRDTDLTALTPYEVPLDSYTANVTVTQDSPVAGLVTILSYATVAGYQRRIQAVVAVDSDTGQVSLISWDQLTL